MARKRSKRGDLSPGTPCLIRSKVCPQHNGKVVIIARYDRHDDAYECSPELWDEADDCLLVWVRESLIPLTGGDGQDEIVRFVGAPVLGQGVRNV